MNNDELDDMSLVTITKSEQLNAVDLLSGSRIIKIRKVTLNKGAAQPASFFYEGDDDKPFMPCKGMRDAIMCKHGWGKKTPNYIGKYLEVFCNPKVIYAGQEVGGVEICGMSHINNDFEVMINVSKGKRKKLLVRKLEVNQLEKGQATPEKPKVDKAQTAKDKAAAIIAEIEAHPPNAHIVLEREKLVIERLKSGYSELHAAIMATVSKLSPPVNDDFDDEELPL